MEPPRLCSRNDRIAARLDHITDVRLSSSVLAHPSAEMSCNGPSPIRLPLPPATWYKPSKLPHAFIHRPMASRAVFSLVASPVSTLAADPNSTCTSSLFSGLRPTATTLAPWLMKNLDAERPSPAVPPMMTMCLFVNIQISYDVIRQMYSVWPTHFGTFRSVDTRILTSAGR